MFDGYLPEEPTPKKYSAEMRWTWFPWRKVQIRVRGYSTPGEAMTGLMKEALSRGWTPPKWWEIWRFRDFPRTEVKSLRIEPSR